MTSVHMEKGKLMKEKLTELLHKCPYLDVLGGLDFYERASEYLIEHGVTVPVGEVDFDYGAEDD